MQMRNWIDYSQIVNQGKKNGKSESFLQLVPYSYPVACVVVFTFLLKTLKTNV